MKERYFMIKKIISIVMLIAIIILSCASTVSAKDYSEVSSGSTSTMVNQSNTLYYKNPHGSFNIRIWVTTSVWTVWTDYSIKMYDNAGKCVWSATNQGDRTYYIGSNVTKIVIVTNCIFGGVTLNWQKK